MATVLVSIATLAREAATELTESTAVPIVKGNMLDRKPALPLRILAMKLENGARNLDEDAYRLAMAGRSDWWRQRHD